MIKIFLTLLLIIFLVGRVFPQNDAEQIFKTIEILSAENFAGRPNGFPEQQETVKFLLKEVQNADLKPLPKLKGYLQKVLLSNYQLIDAQFEVFNAKQNRKFFKEEDFSVLGNSPSSEGEAEVLFASSLKAISDDKIRSRVVLLTADGLNRRQIEQIIRKAYAAGAAGLLFFNAKQLPARLRLPSYIEFKEFFAAAVKDQFVYQLFFDQIRKIDYYLQNPLSNGQMLELKSRLKWKIVSQKVDQANSANIIGFVRGKTKPDEYLLIAAHHDHLGRIAEGYFPGADDNASGVSVVLQLARFWAKQKPQRSLIFAFWCGEEIGLLGSEHFVKNPPLDLQKILFSINLDMVGQGNGINFIGSYYGEQIQSILEKTFAQQKEIRFLRGGPGGSDHTPFLFKGIPSYFIYTSGNHFNYHTIWDHPELINKKLLSDVFNALKQAIEAVDSSKTDLRIRDREALFFAKYADIGLSEPLAFDQLKAEDFYRQQLLDFIFYRSNFSSENRWPQFACELEKISTLPLKLTASVSELKANTRAERVSLFWSTNFDHWLTEKGNFFDLLIKNGLRFLFVDATRFELNEDFLKKLKQIQQKKVALILTSVSPEMLPTLFKIDFPLLVRLNFAPHKPQLLRILGNPNLFLQLNPDQLKRDDWKLRSPKWERICLFFPLSTGKNELFQIIKPLLALRLSSKRITGYLANNFLRFLTLSFGEEVILRRPF